MAGRDGTFQVLDALRTNRRKRRQRGEFLVHGVKAVDAALAAGRPLTRVVVQAGASRSRWARSILDAAPEVVELPADLFAQLGERDEPSELIAVAALTARDLDALGGPGPVLVLDRPASPGNVGTAIRSADAFGAAGVVILGHAADPYDPRAVRASVGSLFAVPLVELGGTTELRPWLEATGRTAIGLDERADRPIGPVAGPVAVVVGNEGRGLSVAARAVCDELRSIPMAGTAATSLNLAVAASITLYEVAGRPR